MDMRLKRIYEEKSGADGFRVLVDRLWPRGVSKEKAALDLWFKDAAPSDDLRKWFGHDPAKWEEFRKRYREELRNNPEATAALESAIGKHKRVTLLFGARDEAHNEAVVLREFLMSRDKPDADA